MVDVSGGGAQRFKHDRIAVLLDQLRHTHLQIESTCVTEKIIQLPARVLKAELYTIEPSFSEIRNSLFVQARRRR